MLKNKIFRDWLNRCGVSDTVIEDIGIVSYTHPRLGESIAIPIADADGNFLFYKFRRSPLREDGPKYLYDKGHQAELFAWHLAKSHDRVLIAEGEKDAMVAWSHGIPAVSSTGGSLTFYDHWAELLSDKEVLVCFDNDEAGARGVVRVLDKISHAKVILIPDKPNVKDISDYVISGGDLLTLLATAKSFTNLPDVLEDRAKRKAMWQSVFFHDAYVKSKESIAPKTPAKWADDALERARQYPIPRLIQIPPSKKIKCLWHKEKTASLHYFSDSNCLYCFGQCGKRYDAIDVYRKLHNCSFKEAYEALGGKE